MKYSFSGKVRWWLRWLYITPGPASHIYCLCLVWEWIYVGGRIKLFHHGSDLHFSQLWPRSWDNTTKLTLCKLNGGDRCWHWEHKEGVPGGNMTRVNAWHLVVLGRCFSTLPFANFVFPWPLLLSVYLGSLRGCVLSTVLPNCSFADVVKKDQHFVRVWAENKHPVAIIPSVMTWCLPFKWSFHRYPGWIEDWAGLKDSLKVFTSGLIGLPRC